MDCKVGPLRIIRYIGMGIVGILTAGIFAFLFGFFVMKLWNWLMPNLFQLRMITFWEGFGLVLLARLIFGSIGHDHDHSQHKHFARHWDRRHRHWDDWADDEWKIKGGWKNWRYYEDWWQVEGKTSFEKYLETRDNKQPDLE